MVLKETNRGSGAKKKAQKHKNEFTYVHQKQSDLTKKITGMPVLGICKRCVDIIAWRKQFGKYKPLTVPKKCVGCSKKAIKDAYHILCQDCAKTKKVCAKCQESSQIIRDHSDHKTEEEKNADDQNYQNWLRTLSERKRRTVLRKQARGDTVEVGEVVSEDSDFDLDLGSDNEDEEEKEEDI